MENTTQNSSIAEAHFACVDAFQILLRASLVERFAPLNPQIQSIQDAFDKYKLWAGNMGAMHVGSEWRKSLDYRLREASFYRVQVLRLLRDLKLSVQKVFPVNQDSQLHLDSEANIIPTSEPDIDDSPWDVSSDSEDYENHSANKKPPAISKSLSVAFAADLDGPKKQISAMELTNFVIKCLWRLPIRRPAPLDRLKDNSASNMSLYEMMDVMHVQNKFPHIDERVANRLGKMISRRRQIMRYRKQHTDALQRKHIQHRRRVIGIGAEETNEANDNSDVGPSLAAFTCKTEDTKATTLRPGVLEGELTRLGINYSPSTSDSMSSIGSDVSEGRIPIVVPKRPKSNSNDPLKEFICPYCQTAQFISTDRKWRKHVLSDLQPYVCTFAECALSNYVFDSQAEWFQHEMQSHRVEWSCNTETHEPFTDTQSFIEHMRVLHHSLFQEKQLSASRNLFQRPTQANSGLCNLCAQISSNLRAHVSKHLKQLALFAIPQTDYMVESDSEDAESNMAHRSCINSMHSEPTDIGTDASTHESSQNNVCLKNDDIAESPEDLAPLDIEEWHIGFVDDEAVDDTSWDYVTPKFQQARAALYSSDGSAPRSTKLRSSSKDSNINPQIDQAASKYPGGMRTTEIDTNDMAVMNPYYQDRPLCGASIGAFNGSHLPPVSLGGIILVDGEPFGLTVHHILDEPSDDESENGRVDDSQIVGPAQPPIGTEPSRDSEHNSEPDLQNQNITQQVSENIPLADTPTSENQPMWDLEISDDEPWPDFAESLGSASGFSETIPDVDIDDGLMNAIGDIPGIPPGQGEHIIITQPAIDDVEEDFFPNNEDRDKDHLLSHAFGHIYASSGIRRWERDGITHEIDWALIKVKPERLQYFNVVQGGRRFHLKTEPKTNPPPLEQPVSRRHYREDEDEYPMEVVNSDSLAGLDVHCFGRTTGLQGGKISSKMHSVRIYRRKTFSMSWTVEGGFGVGGDTGSWVIDNHGRVCGIVLAWCQRNHITYIQPMQIILEDIKRTLNATDVSLPTYKPGEIASHTFNVSGKGKSQV